MHDGVDLRFARTMHKTAWRANHLSDSNTLHDLYYRSNTPCPLARRLVGIPYPGCFYSHSAGPRCDCDHRRGRQKSLVALCFGSLSD